MTIMLLYLHVNFTIPQRRSQLNNRRMSRKHLRPESGRLGITAEDVKQAIAIRLQQDPEAEEKRANNSFMKL